MAKKTFLDFEQPIAELEAKIEELRYVQTESAVDISEEIDQLRKRTGAPPEARLNELEARPDLTAQRDDLIVELVTLYNQDGRSEEALRILAARRFHPWEGGEGLVSGQ